MARLLFTSRSFGSLAGKSGKDNYPKLSNLLGKPIQLMNQNHGDQVVVIDSQISDPTADALVSVNKEIALVVRVADCIPLLLHSVSVIAAVHVGRKGLANQVATKTVEVMRQLGAENIKGVVGPHICGDCYEVGADLFAEFSVTHPASAKKTNHLDLYAGLIEQINDIPLTNMDLCTKENSRYFSYRANAEIYRQVGVISL